MINSNKMIKSNKTLKKCLVCQKEVYNLVPHFLTSHPSLVEKIEHLEQAPLSQQQPVQQQPVQAASISSLIKEKLDIMLNIKIIEMLSNSPDTSLKDISDAINPQPKTTLKELKEMHDLIYPEQQQIVETGNQWFDIAQQAIPIVKDLMQSKKQQGVVNNVRTRETPGPGVLKPIHRQITGDSRESKSDSTKSGTTSRTEQ